METKFNEMRESHQKEKEEIIQSVQNVRVSVPVIDAQINQLKLNKVELNSKDEVVYTLNRNIEHTRNMMYFETFIITKILFKSR